MGEEAANFVHDGGTNHSPTPSQIKGKASSLPPPRGPQAPDTQMPL